MKTLLMTGLILTLLTTGAFAGGSQNRKVVEILIPNTLSSYQVLKAKYEKEIETRTHLEVLLSDTQSYIDEVENLNDQLIEELNKAETQEKIREVIVNELVETEVLPWYWWLATISALLI